ncbi:hypothetical protein FQA39_LY03098 [Lamprigera yunnana]|nr:hypothetical protein FQA39_LY03098 [Lamprigera yunnana]
MKGDEKWHEMRSTLSPSYTSSKMKGIFLLIKECSKQFVDYYSKYDEMVTIEFKDAFSRFANDVIATSAFGIKCDSLKEPNNVFYLMGTEVVSTFRGANLLILLLNMFLPIVSKTLQIPLFSKKLVNFFTSIIKDTIKQREEKHIVRPDMLHLLIEARKGQLQHKKELSIPEAGFAVVEESEIITNSKKRKLSISEEDITAQGFIFFFAGFESISTMMSYTAYELALNPDIQKKLQVEVDETLKGSANDLTYETLMHMKYLDCVISETLRKWPSFVGTNRLCVKPYTIPAEKPDETTLNLEKGMSCFIPIAAIHRDPKYYPNPDKYDPERFNDENRKNIQPYSYLPFGGGPRNCIGSRFALLEAKLLIAEIVSKFEFVVVEKTQIPIKFSRKNFSPVPDEGFWLGLRKR